MSLRLLVETSWLDWYVHQLIYNRICRADIQTQDHTANPPHYYVSIEEIDEALEIWGAITGIQQDVHSISTPTPPAPLSTPVPPVPGSPVDRDYELDRAMARISPTPISGADAINALQLIETTQTAVGDTGAAVSTGASSINLSLAVYVLIYFI
jgi:hypothetical protein